LKKKIIIVILVVVILIIIEVFIVMQVNENVQESVVTTAPPIVLPDIPTEGILLDKETNNETKYWFEVLRYDEIENEFLKKWMDNSIANETLAGEPADGEDPVYYTLYNNSSANLDVYLFMPAGNHLMGDVILSNVRVTEANTALLIYIKTDNDTTHTKESKDLILHIQATSDTTKAKTEKLIIDGVTYTCANATFTALP